VNTQPIAAAMATFLSLAALAQPPLESDEDRTLYTLGQLLGNNVQPFELTEEELDIVIAGMTDAVLGRDSEVDLALYAPRVEAFARERAAASAAEERAEGEPFLEQKAAESGAERMPSGLIFIPMEEGDGPNPAATDIVRVHYHGTLRDGTVFDSSVERGEPISLPLDQVIPCWTEGVQMMRVGGKAELVCPPELAYGDSGQPGIPPGATLVFEVDLIGIE
jgi:FKBP-type peptidyl-prolyl cis-trans isomerase FkpA